MALSLALTALAEGLEARARAAESVAELGISMANDSFSALSYRQALVFDANDRLLTVSGLARPTEDSPYLIWLRQAWPWLRQRVADEAAWISPTAEELADAPPALADGWSAWWPAGAYVLPLARRGGEPLGAACFLLDQPPAPEVAQLLARVARTWAYAWEMMAGKARPSLRERWARLDKTRRRLLVGALCLLLLLPVRQTALAPAEVVPVDAMEITAAIDGVVSTIHVSPNQAVKAGDRLFSLDDTTLRNRLEVARQSVAVADAELASASQMAFHDSASKAELTILTGRAQERRAELAAVQAQLARMEATAPYDGIAVFADPDQWRGRPVATGERIMLLANPEKPGMLIHLPVSDAIALDEGAPVKLFLTVKPLSPLSGQITETSYQAVLSPDGVASYRLRADIAGDDVGQARLGLRGTAKLHGDWVVLGYYLFRRPLATLREWSGW